MKHILKFFALLLVTISCQKEEMVIKDMSVGIGDIKRIELRTDSHTLIPDGKAKLRFYHIVYGEKTVPKYTVIDGNYVTDNVTVEYVIPNDLLTNVDFEITDNQGNKIGAEGYSTTKLPKGTIIEFKARAGQIESSKLAVTIREVPAEQQEELVIPVIFQLITPPTTTGVQYEVTTQHLEKVINRVNDVFNRRATTDPNGGNAKVTFKLALYDQKGNKLVEPGINRVDITNANIEEIKIYGGGTTAGMINGYNRYFVKNKSKFIWDPTKYLNIWVMKLAADESLSEDGASSYKYLAPKYVHSSFQVGSIPGLKLTAKDSFTLDDMTFDGVTYSKTTNCLEVGFMVNYASLINPMVQGGNAFNLSTAFGYYYGLLDTKITGTNPPAYPTTDNDYCNDTNFYHYNTKTNNSIFKDDSNLTKRPAGAPIKYFTSFNVMDIFTYGNSVTADQAARMRSVLEKCPTRWAYKSSFALTGK